MDDGNRSFGYYRQRLFAHAFCEAMQGSWGKVVILIYCALASSTMMVQGF